MIIDFRLSVFQAVAEKLSFTKAAHALFISQPAVTRHINELEKQIGKPLFHRHGSRISLTSEGKLLQEYARQILSLYQSLSEEIGHLQQQQAGLLRIGASTTIAQYILPPLLAQFKKSYPSVQLTLISENTEHIEALLQDGSIDVGMVEGETQLPQLHYEPFVQDELVLVTSISNLNSLTTEITPQDLLHVPLVLREPGSGTRDIVEAALEKLQLRRKDLQVEIELGSTESIKQYLLHSHAYAFLSVHTIAGELAAGKLKIVEITGPAMHRTFRFCMRHGQHARLVLQFCQFCRNRYNPLL
ncbi:LysR substrate-binding domain-containing protein [Pontibacter kalidii]|uniref:LysR substrate-binding domain-containing protein n=1 Tax=Pontibacter kalidii TaxID=2592049 RepID=UPI002255AB12|nr:LysR substrate-binding domain-containing protein [Pontibacter kalidii]